MLTEIYQYLFILSIVFIAYIIGDLAIKTYGRFKLQKDTKFVLSLAEKIILWLSIATIFSYTI
jgi:hypothetical protein